MAVRTTPGDVRGIIEVDQEVNLVPFIKAASILVDQLQNADEDSELGTEDLKVIETYIAAHCYSFRDQRIAEEQKGRARARYQGQTGKYLEATFYGQFAISLDRTGFLAGLGTTNHRVEVIWGGTDYDDVLWC